MNRRKPALGLMVPLGMEIKTPLKRREDLYLSQQTCCVWQQEWLCLWGTESSLWFDGQPCRKWEMWGCFVWTRAPAVPVVAL